MSHDRIVSAPNIMAGKPAIKGTRVKAEPLLRLLSRGNTIENLLVGYPQLTREDILTALGARAGGPA